MFLLEAGGKDIYVIGNKDFQKETVQKLGIAPENFWNFKPFSLLSLYILYKNDRF